jgi:hypothetical protein
MHGNTDFSRSDDAFPKLSNPSAQFSAKRAPCRSKILNQLSAVVNILWEVNIDVPDTYWYILDTFKNHNWPVLQSQEWSIEALLADTACATTIYLYIIKRQVKNTKVSKCSQYARFWHVKRRFLNILLQERFLSYFYIGFLEIFHLLLFPCCGRSPQSGFKMEVFTYHLWSYDANRFSTLKYDWPNIQTKSSLFNSKAFEVLKRKLHIIELQNLINTSKDIFLIHDKMRMKDALFRPKFHLGF